LPEGLAHIAQRRLSWQQKIATLQAGLWLPKAILLLGLFASVFVRMLTADQNAWEAISSVMPTVIIVWGLIHLSLWLLKNDSLTWLSIGWRFRLVRENNLVYKLVFEQAFYRLLIWQIEAGVVLDQALKSMSSMLTSSNFQQRTYNAAGTVSQGASLSQSLSDQGLVLTKELHRVLQTGLQAGSLEKAVAHHIKWQQQIISHKAEQFLKWLPRVYYFIVLLAVSQMMTI